MNQTSVKASLCVTRVAKEVAKLHANEGLATSGQPLATPLVSSTMQRCMQKFGPNHINLKKEKINYCKSLDTFPVVKS